MMTGYKMPIFTKGSLLSQEMLEALKDFEIKFAENKYAGFSDGIITGVSVQVTQGVVYIKSGMIKYKNKIFFIPDNTKVSIAPNNKWQVIRVVFEDLENTVTFEEQKMSIEVTENLDKEINTIEICRVRLQDGAKLRSHYKNFEDLNTEFDTINLINSQWAAYGKASINPLVLNEFVKEASNYTIENSQDMCFVQQILNNNGHAFARDFIQFYLNNRIGKKSDDYDNKEIYEGLLKVLELIKTGTVQKTEMKKPRRLIVE